MPTSRGKGEQRRKLHPPFAQPDPGRRAAPHMAVDVPEGLPSIDRFVDDLPPIGEFLLQLNEPEPVSAEPVRPVTTGVANLPAARTEADTEGWVAADWQSYDWSGLASLGAPEPEAAAAHAAWSTTNWDAGRAGSTDRAIHLREDEVASALDELARRIRSGELSLHQFRGSPPEAALAAAFASLLRNRD